MKDNILILSKKDCVGCSACENICPSGCIAMKMDEQSGFYYPELNEIKCIYCGMCVNVCPALKKETVYSSQSERLVYAAQSLNNSLKKISTSGGVFAEIARYILGREGIVYGVAMDENIAKHIRIDSPDELFMIQGSKYVQSDTRSIFNKVVDDLNEKREVLFSGTPCQIAAITNYVKLKASDKEGQLYCVDLVCHGVGSPGVWARYIEETAKGEKLEKFIFRDKSSGWKKSSVSYEIGGVKKIINEKDCAFMEAYGNNLCIRDSCFVCRHKGIERMSDITLGDCWGYDGQCFHDDDSGVNLVIVHSDKGRKIFSELEESRVICGIYDLNLAVKSNQCIVKSTSPNDRKRVFDTCLKQGDTIKKACRKALKVNLLIRIYRGMLFRLRKQKG